MAFQVKIHQIRAFVEVARQGSIRGASRMLNMSQPALSKSIQELEEGLAALSLVAKSDFLSILPEEMGCDPLHGQGLVMLPVSEILPKAAYYLIQRRDSRQTPLTASLITQFRRECGYLQS
ncbi:TPA: LysR family transcriptional regulator [Escherichia coli]|uniref:LysR family transcriptional regulator n=1 Tax=Enterobacteriaceae TaxID=543 RepID=UPI0005308ED4|nr:MULTISPECIES: LysR family transcriptional regulator [Enterobacteriaceae]AKM34900.1 bacterial regulatory helix-turn-helix, lysR family protein [Escherichia coli PCN061]APK53652.1 hypothetical protein RG45_13515 [Escherichia coli]ATC02939.1 hypothetical protein CNQ50_13360 [Escherichia coli]AUZ00289.1 hypothetical protein BWI90_07510 [Escherichia coli]EEW2017429.1 LysR family transcriptional regulator [Escherichia coli]